MLQKSLKKKKKSLMLQKSLKKKKALLLQNSPENWAMLVKIKRQLAFKRHLLTSSSSTASRIPTMIQRRIPVQ
uniref:Uncharacterized protein n=1 Tax=Romanomermis culicivorax TaxID=13658 RepID=A0A915KZR1_ROMCU